MNAHQLQKRIDRNRASKSEAAHIDRVNREVEAQERREADEERAFDLLDSVGSLDDSIAHGLIAEDAQHRLTITEAGWTLARSLGWKAS